VLASGDVETETDSVSPEPPMSGSTTAAPTAVPPVPEGETDDEFVQGEVRPVAPVNDDHLRTVGRVLVRVGSFVQEHDLGDVGPEGGYVFQREPDTVFLPDLSFVRADRVPPLDQQQGYPDLVPDFVVEVLFSSNHVGRKRHAWRRRRSAGLLGPRRRSFRVGPILGLGRVVTLVGG